MLRLIKVTGDSLYPEYGSGDFVITSKIPVLFGSLRTGDVVVLFRQPYGLLVKRIERIEPGGKRMFVLGTQLHSVDSRRFGWVDRKEIIGKVLYHSKKSQLRK
jgi:phage repressor protein C with HTH and peptisase S24 domain